MMYIPFAPQAAMPFANQMQFRTSMASQHPGEPTIVPESFEDGGCARLLPPNFYPSPFDAVLGRGKVYIEHAGNKHLRSVVLAALPEYSAAKSRIDKSSVITKVVHQVQSMSPTGSGFVKFDVVTSRWFDCSEYLGRERVGQLFRDVLSNKYKSSRLSKKKRREQRIKSSKSSSSLAGSETSDTCSGSSSSDSTWYTEDQGNGASYIVDIPLQVPSAASDAKPLLSSVLEAYSVFEFNPSDNPYEPTPMFHS